MIVIFPKLLKRYKFKGTQIFYSIDRINVNEFLILDSENRAVGSMSKVDGSWEQTSGRMILENMILELGIFINDNYGTI